ncbi:serine hydrolase domain-containing protein [Bacillus chungangensis]|uniref:CubicO group peptidase (Beta-lactamase class C family) n=2 Tax=Bacillus chungangensis TaxID=587633 RepID=A0ABT9WXW5_9BACI|nr:serine hydrolase domain-containing protein [Bacillus chungangensis]MDQ0178070.1 CubicO group peptidase (beta-lactamase class C family) [Bacillus chungangensis]
MKNPTERRTLMKKTINQSQLDEIMSYATTKKNIFGAVLCVEKEDDSLSLVSGVGNIQPDDQYFIASVTKLYITAVILKLRLEKQLQLDDKISKYLSKEIVSHIHVFKGIDYSNEITIKHLMSNTSGIPEYFSSDVIKELVINGNDDSWPLEKTLEVIKEKKPNFIPGQKGKASYSDPNYKLLGKIIETITGKRIQDVLKEFIFDELKLEKTYVFEDVKDSRPVPIYYKSKPLHLPLYMSSISSEGGVVSTAKETMIFFRAFFNGHFFPKENLTELMHWNLIFGPGVFYYGIGISQQPLSLFEFKRGLIGHWGHSGAFAFYHPKTDIYFTGTINQFTGHGVAVKLMRDVIKFFKE